MMKLTGVLHINDTHLQAFLQERNNSAVSL